MTKIKRPLQENAMTHKFGWVMLIPATVLVLFGVFCFFVAIMGSYSFVELFVTILLTTLGFLCIYNLAVKKRAIRVFSQVIAWVFALIIIVATTFWFSGANEMCTGLMGVQTSCMSTNRLIITILLVNSYSLILWTILATIGVAGLVVKTKKL